MNVDHGPFKIRLLRQVRSDFPISGRAAEPGEHLAWCNDRGAVMLKVQGEPLGLFPDQFEYITLPPAGIPLAVTKESTRAIVDRLLGLLHDAWRDGYCWNRTVLDRDEMDKGWKSSKFIEAVAARQVTNSGSVKAQGGA